MRLRWSGRRLMVAGLLLVLGACIVCVVIEQSLERRDAARLTADATFQVAGNRHIRYYRTGNDAAGPTVVFLNGMMSSLEQWDSVQRALGPDTNLLSYDRAGTGFSDFAAAHGAAADADELNALLDSGRFKAPYVLVGFSSASMLEVVYAARRPDIVKGLVFVNPTQRVGAKSFHRIFWRPVIVNPLQALLGYTRFKLFMEDRAIPQRTPVSERVNAILANGHHWISSSLDVLSLDESADAADAALVRKPFADVPLGVLTTITGNENAYRHEYFERDRTLADGSRRGRLVQARGSHEETLNDPLTTEPIVALIREILAEVRAQNAL